VSQSARGPRRVGVLGGTFDPIHLGHLVAASEALHQLTLDEVVFVPAGRPWQKNEYAPQEDRFMMTSLAVVAHARFSASRIELDRRGPTYTVDTLTTMREFWGDESSLYFIAGADAVAKLSTWRDVAGLGRLAEVVAFSRPGTDAAAIVPEDGWPRLHRLDMPAIGVSGTDIRRRVAAGAPIDFLVPAEVAAYIGAHGLYERAEEPSDGEG
jgi:nicotinate-nucleotide adenylyltransferase